jgi:hypothetical protein
MTDTYADLDAALDRVVAAARAHLAAVKAADHEPDDDAVWRAYVALNNASHEYDELLNDVFSEVTPWDVESISNEEAEGRTGLIRLGADATGAVPTDDPYPRVISVRQRRDYRVPSVAALVRAADEARGGAPPGSAELELELELEPIGSVSEAVLELLQAGDGSMGMLDIAELDPLDGLVVVVEVDQPLDPDEHAESDAESPFRVTGAECTVGRLDERALPDIDEFAG